MNAYYVSSYEKGDSYSEVTFYSTDLKDIQNSVEYNVNDWIETIYDYAILWSTSNTYLPFCSIQVCGVYDVETSNWIDYEVKEITTDSDYKKEYVLKFDNIELPVTPKVGLGFGGRFTKNKLL